MSRPGETDKRYCLGTHRIRPPEETREQLRGVLPQAGITRVADVTALDVFGIPVYQAVRPAARNLSVSQGKGGTPAAAWVSAVMEALELWHAEDLSALPQMRMSLREMRMANAIPLRSLRWATAGPLPEALPIPWLRARSLRGETLAVEERDGWLPRAMLELDFSRPPGFAPPLFNFTSNGLASGNCIEEALLHGICELIERHALFLAGREPERKVLVDLASIDCPWCAEMIDRMRSAGFKVAVSDLTWEVGVPVFEADVAGPDLPNVWRGSGSHPSPSVALSRALTEAAQSRLTYISGARDDLVVLPGNPSWSRVFAGFEEAREGSCFFPKIQDLSTSEVATDLAQVVERLAGQGLVPFFVDYTRPEVGVAVAASFIPGLREAPHA